jgi:hypothetical protein
MILRNLLLRYDLLKTQTLPVRQDLVQRDTIPGNSAGPTPGPGETEVPPESMVESSNNLELKIETQSDTVSAS